MNLVQPNRDEKKINTMKKILKAESLRDCAMFTVGINSGLRITDLLSLTFGHVMEDGVIKEKIYVYEKKTKKNKEFVFGPKTRKVLEEYISSIDLYKDQDPLFFSKKFDKDEKGKRKPISRQHAHYVISEAAKESGIKESIGTHTLRKTFGYHAYKKGVDIVYIQQLLNHDSPKTTLRYIGITQDELNDIYFNLDL